MNKTFKYSLIALAVLIAGFVIVRLLDNGSGTAVQLRTATVGPTSLVSSGIGLANLKKRLTLIYPGRHQLTTRVDADRYEAVLRIHLDHLAP